MTNSRKDGEPKSKSLHPSLKRRGTKRICHHAQFFITSHGSFQHFTNFLKKKPQVLNIKDIHLANMAWWLKSAGALNFALSQE